MGLKKEEGQARPMKNSSGGSRTSKILIFALTCIIFTPGFSTETQGAERDNFSATLVEYWGEVLIQKPGEELWLPVDTDIPIEQGDRIKTGNNAYVEILVDDGSLLQLEENSAITLTELSVDHKTKRIASRMFLWFGRLLSNIKKFTHKRSRFEVYTPTAVVGVRGTEFVVEAVDSDQTEVGVFDGEVSVGSVDKDGKLITQYEVRVTKDRQTSVRRNRRPSSPLRMRGRMLARKEGMGRLRNKAADRRRNLQGTIEKRSKAKERIQKRWDRIRKERPKNMKRPARGKKQRTDQKKLKNRKNGKKKNGKKRNGSQNRRRRRGGR